MMTIRWLTSTCMPPYRKRNTLGPVYPWHIPIKHCLLNTFADHSFENKQKPTMGRPIHSSERDATGREVEMIPISSTEGQAVYDTRRLAPGTYTIELVNGGNTVGTAKLVVKQ